VRPDAQVKCCTVQPIHVRLTCASTVHRATNLSSLHATSDQTAEPTPGQHHTQRHGTGAAVPLLSEVFIEHRSGFNIGLPRPNPASPTFRPSALRHPPPFILFPLSPFPENANPNANPNPNPNPDSTPTPLSRQYGIANEASHPTLLPPQPHYPQNS
jgi:hypothetical protein